jgi:hypothetical protein
MSFLAALGRRRFEMPCTVEIENTPQSLHAHVELDGDFVIEPGDEVQVIDAPDRPPYGERLLVRRKAVVIRAGALERLWTRLVGNFELTELYDVSFTERMVL